MDIVVARCLPFALDFSFLAGVVLAVAGVLRFRGIVGQCFSAKELCAVFACFSAFS